MIRRAEQSETSVAQRLVDRVALRLSLDSIGSAWSRLMGIAVAAGLIALLIRRFGGHGFDWLTPDVLWGVPVCAVLIAMAASRKATRTEAARMIDEASGARELFLTLAQLESSVGEYQDVIIEQADVRATGMRPSEIAPWNWLQPLCRLVAGAAVLVSAILFLPQHDLFGTADPEAAAVAVRRDLQQSRRETANRMAELSIRLASAELADELDASLLGLATELRQLVADRTASSMTTLEDQQREIEDRWRELRSDESVARLADQAQSQQIFGASDHRGQKLVEGMSQGKTDSLDGVFETLKDGLDNLGTAIDGEQQQKQERQIRKEIAELQRFAGNQLQSLSAEAAMKRAMLQLDAARLDPSLKSEAAEAARETVELAQSEMHEIAKNVEQLASLEQALTAIQSAKQLKQQGSRGSGQKNETTILKFVDQFASLQSDEGEQKSASDRLGKDQDKSKSTGKQPGSVAGQPGTQNPGQVGENSSSEAGVAASKSSVGAGENRSVPPENKLLKTEFRDSRENASFSAERRLLALRRRGLSDAGETSEEYRELVRNLQKRVASALEVEQIPPGYVPGIRSYFDSLSQHSNEDRSKEDESAESIKSKTTGVASEVADEAP